MLECGKEICGDIQGLIQTLCFLVEKWYVWLFSSSLVWCSAISLWLFTCESLSLNEQTSWVSTRTLKEVQSIFNAAGLWWCFERDYVAQHETWGHNPDVYMSTYTKSDPLAQHMCRYHMQRGPNPPKQPSLVRHAPKANFSGLWSYLQVSCHRKKCIQSWRHDVTPGSDWSIRVHDSHMQNVSTYI